MCTAKPFKPEWKCGQEFCKPDLHSSPPGFMCRGRRTRTIFKVPFKARSCPTQIAYAVAQGLQCSCQWPRQGYGEQMLPVQPKLGRFSTWILSRSSAAAQTARLFPCLAFPHTALPKALSSYSLWWTMPPLSVPEVLMYLSTQMADGFFKEINYLKKAR